MPVLVIFTSSSMNKKMYDDLRPEVNWETQHPVGAIFHVCGFDDAGHLHVVDVWESSEALQKFVETRLGPAMQKLNIPMPDVAVYPTHNINAYHGIEKYRLT